MIIYWNTRSNPQIMFETFSVFHSHITASTVAVEVTPTTKSMLAAQHVRRSMRRMRGRR